LATSGQLSAAESDVLNQHLLECENCRSFLKDAHFISDKLIPQVLRVPRGEARVPAGMRERFLARATQEGLQIHAGPPVVVETFPVDFEPHPQVSQPSRQFLSPHTFVSSLRPWQAWSLVASACIACFVLGAAVVRMPSLAAWHTPATSAAATRSQATQAQPATDPGRDRIHALTAERDQLGKQITDLASQLEAVKKEKEETEASLQQKLSTVQSEALHDHDALAQQSTALSVRVADLQSQLDTVRQQQSLAETDLKSARAKTAEYSARLDLEQTQLRNQETAPLPSADEIGSLVAARNLHIIDVYDSNAAGQRQHAFGRVFYVEGRSLVFYAYDLAAAHAQKNITFHLWGEKAGSKETTLSLGVLHDDDPRERRWALTFDDPKVLAKINSVYVTAESNSKQSDAPHGPRVLYAYFGAQPNHP
jgi:predicted  nucleic acid-binding Zn-ribbon protein